jgi:hypothetical protein
MFGCSTCMCMYIYISSFLICYICSNIEIIQKISGFQTFEHSLDLPSTESSCPSILAMGKSWCLPTKIEEIHINTKEYHLSQKRTPIIYIYIFVHHRVVFLCLVIWQPKINWMKLGWYIHEQSWIYHLSQKKETNIHLKQKVCQCSCSRLWLSALFQKYGKLCWHHHHHPHHHPQKTEALTRSKTGQEYVYLGSNFIHMKLQTSQVKESPSHFNRNWTVQLNFPLVN